MSLIVSLTVGVENRLVEDEIKRINVGFAVNGPVLILLLIYTERCYYKLALGFISYDFINDLF